ncbi:thiamine pyrophosphate-binding protein [Leucobacter celer]|uniref:thiamine pyrophosphate-binding protein n=1 Tax=Leucobacter celer TaxID=668625 RepID=UPI0006A787A2|nr:thiamine pyrophosphate-binding protein [Leucobacter celer]
MERNGAEIIVDHLIAEGVPYAVGLCGHGNLGLLDALYDRQSEIKTISVHHESVAGFVAEIYFRITGKPIATFTSSGPGSANMPVALGSALMDDAAFIAITGNVATTQFGRGPFQESGRFYQADFPSVVRPYVKRSFQATRPEQLPLMLRQAFGIMTSGRKGPVHLDVPLDVFVERTSAEIHPSVQWRGTGSNLSAAARSDIDQIIELLLSAERPVIVAGHGVEGDGANDELLVLAELTGIPVATSPLGKAVIDNRHPLAVGPTGRNGTLVANRTTRNADLVLAFGTRFDDRSTSSWLPGFTYEFSKTKLVHVHIDPLELGRNFPVAVGVPASPGLVISQVLEELEERGVGARWGAWGRQVQTWKSEWAEAVAPPRISESSPIQPQRVLADLRAVMPDETIVFCDVGVHHNWVVQEWEARGPRTLQQSWGFASMGFGVSGPIGAHLAAPDAPSVSVVGDGGFLMLPGVVATAVEYKIPAKWVVWNNGGFTAIRDQQRLYFGEDRELATSFLHDDTGERYDADFVALARSMGGDGIRVENPEDLIPAFQKMLDSDVPFIVDVKVDDTVAVPPVATWELPPLPFPEPGVGWPDPDLAY